MSYRLTQIGDRSYVGMPGNGDLNIEVWTKEKREPDAELEAEVYLPADAVSELFEYLRRHA